MIYREPTCHTCGEALEGDGFYSVMHCPNAVEQPGHDFDVAPDSNPIYCHLEHWADNHILENFDTGEFDAFDEAGLLLGTYDSREQARDALDQYAKTL